MKKLLLSFLMASALLFAFAQDYNKMSMGTQMFLDERKGEVRITSRKVNRRLMPETDTILRFVDPALEKQEVRRLIAEPEMVKGMEMISAFIKVNDGNFGTVESLGAVMQTRFNDQLAAMMLPVDKIEAISELSNVANIEVAEVLEPMNDQQRGVTQAIDAITNSEAAQALGIPSDYTGKGVILGMIDSGIDFQHLAFKDKNGNSRIVRAYKLTSASGTGLTTYSTASQIASLTYDSNDGDHGTHTSATAGGSSVIVNGNNVTVTDDHANATYGGMAPDVDLVIAGLSSLYTTSIGTAIQNICNYADQVGKPCVISMSFGSLAGPHDGTGSIASIVNQYAGNNHILVFSAGNNAMRPLTFVEAGTSNGGGCYASGLSTSSKPMLANVQRSFSNADGNVEMYYPTITAYARKSNVPTALRFHVVKVSTGEVVYSSNAYTQSTTISVTGTTGLAQYFKCPSSQYSNLYGDEGAIRIIRTLDNYNNKYYWQVYAPMMISTSYSGSSIYESDYAFCVSVYPTSNTESTIIDMWENQYCWFGRDLTLNSSTNSNYNLVQGSDDCSVGLYPCVANAISVGAYVTKNSITNYAGTTTDYSARYPNIGDHAYFSSYQVAGSGPTGTALPTINAPGARIVSAINHYHTASVDDDSYWAEDNLQDLVVNSTSAYGAMQGTSMSTPCAAGIIALWLQACVEAGKTPTPDYIKEVMAATWDTDQWTQGAGHGSATFGTHGKINALKGIQYILGCSSGPVITSTPAEVAFDETFVGTTPAPTKTFNVKGVNLQGNITLTLNDPNGVFSLSSTQVTQTQAAAGKDITVTFNPKAAVNYQATVTLTSTGAESVIVTLTATGKIKVPFIMTEPEELSLQAKVNESGTGKFTVMGENLTGNITLTLGDPDGVFTLDKTTITKAQAESADGCEVTATFTPLAMTDYNTTVTLSSPGAEPVTITLNGSPLKPYFIFDPEELTFNAATDEPVSKTVQILAENIYGDVQLSLDDPSGVFSLSTTSIPAAEAEDLAEVTVSLYAENEGTYEAYLVITTPWGEDDEYVKLTAIVNDGGTASDSYLNIAKYATIDTAGWNTTYVNKLYQYKEYEQTNVGWLTLPVYGAWSSIYYSPKAQNWIKTNVTNTNNKYAGSTWSSNGELLGSSVYFTGTSGNGSARAMGYNAWNNYTQETFSFYVTNTTAVKLLGLGQSRASSSYPASLKIYECTKNADGSLTDGTTAVKSYTNSATSGAFVLSATGLDESKIYKVEAATYRSYLCEIAFCTPLPEIVTLRQLVSEGVEKKAYKIKDGNIRVVMISEDGKRIYCKDDNDYASPSVPKDGEVDYSLNKAKIMSGSWDQSNWVALQLDNGKEWGSSQLQLVGHLLENVTGKLKDKTNPVFVVNSKSLPTAYSTDALDYITTNPNVFITCNMVSTTLQGADGVDYFFVAPKPMEIAIIKWAFWDGEKFTVPPYVPGKVNELQFEGAYYIDMSELEYYQPTLETNHIYEFLGLIKREHTTSSRLNVPRDVSKVSTDYVVYPLGNMSDVGSIVGNVITGVNDLIPGKTVKAMRYFDTLGRVSTKPFTGINIIEVEYTDGTHQVIKQLLK